MKIETFLCDTCNKALDVPSNPNGITLLPRCVITANCNGKMSQVKKLLVSKEQYLFDGSNNSAWSRRSLLYTHTQAAPRKLWVVEHDLGNIPILTIYTIDLLGNPTLADKTNYKITSNTDRTANIEFNTATSGYVECVLRQFTAQQNLSASVATSTTNLELTPTYVLAIASNIPNLQSIELNIKSKTDTVVQLSVDSPLIDLTPWANLRYVLIDNQRFQIYAFNMTGLAPLANVLSSFHVSKINNQSVVANSSYILLSNAPYSGPADRNLANAIDVATLAISNQSLTSIIDRVLYADSSLVRSLYPTMELIT